MNEQDIKNQETQLSSFPQPVTEANPQPTAKLETPTAQEFDIGFGPGKWHPDDVHPDAQENVAKLNSVVKLAEHTTGLQADNPNAASPEQKHGFVSTLKDLFSGTQIANDPIGKATSQAYFNSLMTGGGIAGASKAASDVYQKMSEVQQTGEQSRLTEQLKQQYKNAPLLAAAKNTTNDVIGKLSNVGTPAEQIQQQIPNLEQRLQEIYLNSKEAPEAAMASGRSMMSSLVQQKLPVQTITAIAKTLPIKIPDELNAAYSKAGLRDELKFADFYGYATKEQALEIEAKLQKSAAKLEEEKTKATEAAKFEIDKTRAGFDVNQAARKAGAETGARLNAEGRYQLSDLGKQVEAQKIETEGKKAAATAQGTAAGKAQSELPAAKATAEATLTDLDELLKHPAFNVNVGVKSPVGSALSHVPATDSKAFHNLLTRIKGEEFATAIKTLQGTGSVSNTEGQAALDAQAKLDPGLSQKDFIKNVEVLRKVIKDGVAAKEKSAIPAAPSAPGRPSLDSFRR